jgi:hypothetical protein
VAHIQPRRLFVCDFCGRKGYPIKPIRHSFGRV